MAETFFQRLQKQAADAIALSLVNYMTADRIDELTRNRQYYEGRQRQPLKVKSGQGNDNLITNWIGLAVDRSNSMLFGGGVEFTVTDEAQNQWLQDAWTANKKNILLQRTGMDGELAGTWYIKLVPDALEYNNATYPRLVLLDPSLMSIETDPMDIERVIAYIFEMKVSDSKSVREVTRRASDDGEIVRNEVGLEEGAPAGSWVVESWVSEGSVPTWKLVKSVVWPYPFPPIVHAQNLPSVHNVYGADGLSGGLDVQDKYNFVDSNILKIIRYHAHPRTWARGLPANSSMEKVSWGGDEMIKATSESAEIRNLEMQSDLASSRAEKQDLKAAVFELNRSVDIASLKDKIGNITNLGLRLLYSDALAKNATRRELYGDALSELCRRMLMLAGAVDVGDVTVTWGADLPADEVEDAKLILADLAAGLVSKETASEARGYTWKSSNDGTEIGEQDRIANESAATGDQANAALARLFAGTTQP